MRASWLAVALLIPAHGAAVASNASMATLADAISGTWSIAQHDEPGPTTARGDDGVGEEVWSVGAGGMPLIESYHAKFATYDAYDYAAFWFNGATHRIEGLFCAGFVTTGCAPFTAEWDGRTLAAEGEFAAGGKTYRWRETFAFDTPDTFTQTLHQGESGAELTLGTTIHAQRR